MRSVARYDRVKLDRAVAFAFAFERMEYIIPITPAITVHVYMCISVGLYVHMYQFDYLSMHASIHLSILRVYLDWQEVMALCSAVLPALSTSSTAQPRRCKVPTTAFVTEDDPW